MALQLSPGDIFIAESGMPMDFPEQYKFKISKQKAKGHLKDRGNHAWSNEETTVTEAAGVKILFIKIIYSFRSNPGCGCEILSAAALRFHVRPEVGPRVDQPKIGWTKLEEAINPKTDHQSSNRQ